MASYSHFADAAAIINAPATAVFDFLDDQANLSSHMSEPSWMMLGTTMDIHMDGAKTRAVGSEFGFTGRLLGIPLGVEEIITRRDPPTCKEWETVGEPNLWVIGRYRMGFELATLPEHTKLRVHIAYDRPAKAFRSSSAGCSAACTPAGAPARWQGMRGDTSPPRRLPGRLRRTLMRDKPGIPSLLARGSIG